MEKKSINYSMLFFVTVIVVGLIVLLMLSLKLIKKNDGIKGGTTTTKTTEKVSKNKGVYKSLVSPALIGETVIATFNDDKNNLDNDVDITGIRFIEGDEANMYANEDLKEGFKWEGFEYTVTFNELDYLNEVIDPKMNVEIYNDTGSNYITYNGHNNIIKVNVINDYKFIKNNESANVKVFYQIPDIKEYNICFGYRDKKLSCFIKS